MFFSFRNFRLGQFGINCVELSNTEFFQDSLGGYIIAVLLQILYFVRFGIKFKFLKNRIFADI